MKTEQEVEGRILKAYDKKELNPAVRDVLLALLEFLSAFLHKWFLTPKGERKSFFKALLVAFYAEFWNDLLGVKKHLDAVVNAL